MFKFPKEIFCAHAILFGFCKIKFIPMDFLDNDLNNLSTFSPLEIGPLGGRRQPRHCILRKLADETLSDLATAAVAYNCLSPSSG